MLMPRGAARLRKDLGAFLRKRRRGEFGDQAYGTQSAVAARVGVTRQTMSKIERGAAWPGPGTLDALLDVLDLGWEDVAHPEPGFRRFHVGAPLDGETLAPERGPTRHRVFMEGPSGDLLLAFGGSLRAFRKARRLTLGDLATSAGISLALLSRLERGQVRRSSIFRFEVDPDDLERPKLVVLNPRLAEAAEWVDYRT